MRKALRRVCSMLRDASLDVAVPYEFLNEVVCRALRYGGARQQDACEFVEWLVSEVGLEDLLQHEDIEHECGPSCDEPTVRAVLRLPTPKYLEQPGKRIQLQDIVRPTFLRRAPPLLPLRIELTYTAPDGGLRWHNMDIGVDDALTVRVGDAERKYDLLGVVEYIPDEARVRMNAGHYVAWLRAADR